MLMLFIAMIISYRGNFCSIVKISNLCSGEEVGASSPKSRVNHFSVMHRSEGLS